MFDFVVSFVNNRFGVVNGFVFFFVERYYFLFCVLYLFMNVLNVMDLYFFCLNCLFVFLLCDFMCDVDASSSYAFRRKVFVYMFVFVRLFLLFRVFVRIIG